MPDWKLEKYTGLGGERKHDSFIRAYIRSFIFIHICPAPGYQVPLLKLGIQEQIQERN